MTISQVIILVIGCLIIYLLLYRPDKNQGSNAAIFWVRKMLCLWHLESSILYRSIVANAIVDCVRANYHACSLECPAGIANHLAPWGYGVKPLKSGQIALRYKFRRASICPGGGVVQYTTVPIQTMLEILNQSFGNYCIQYGLPQMPICGMNINNGQVCFYVVPFNNWDEAINYLRSMGVMI